MRENPKNNFYFSEKGVNKTGREIRRVPKGWEHPKDEHGRYLPLHDDDYETVLNEWINNHNLWLEGKHPDQIENPEKRAKYKYFAEWDGNAPDVEYYRPKWTDEECTHYQVYETVSEGTPVTPAFAIKEELIDYLVEYGTFYDPTGFSRDVAENFVAGGWVLSGIAINGNIKFGINCAEILKENKE